MKRIAAFTVSAMLLMGQSSQPAVRSVTAVRHWTLKGVTRVAIEFSGSFQFHTDRLHNPERVYYDLQSTHLKIDSKRYYAETVGDSLLQKIRVAENTPGTTRVVLDLTGDVGATTTILTSPDRLVIELRMQAGNPLRTEPPPTRPVGSAGDHAHASASPHSFSGSAGCRKPAPVLPKLPTNAIPVSIHERARGRRSAKGRWNSSLPDLPVDAPKMVVPGIGDTAPGFRSGVR